MNRTTINILFLITGLLGGISCSKDSTLADDKDIGLPEWNKNRTAAVLLYSRMTDKPLFLNTDYTQIVSKLKTQIHQVAILDGVNVVYGEAGIVNPTVTVAANSGKISLFAEGGYENNMVHGSGILIGHTFTKTESYPIATDCAIFSVPTKINVYIPMTFNWLSIHEESQIVPAATTIKKNLNNEGVLVGTVDKTMKETLASQFPAATYRFYSAESSQGATIRIIFVVTTKKWIVREAGETLTGSNGISCFEIKIEALQ